MKKVAGYTYILMRLLMTLMLWPIFLVLVAGSFVDLLLQFHGELLGFLEAYYPIRDLAQGFIFMPVVFAVLMYGMRFLEDYLYKTKPVFLGLIELTGEMGAWLPSFLMIETGASLAMKLIRVFVDPALLDNNLSSMTEFVGFFLDGLWFNLIAIAVLVLISMACKIIHKMLNKD